MNWPAAPFLLTTSHSLQERLHHPQALKVYTCGQLFPLSPSLVKLYEDVSSTVCFLSCVNLPFISIVPWMALRHVPTPDMSTSIINAIVLTVMHETQTWEIMAGMLVAIGALRRGGPLGTADKELCELFTHKGVRSVRALQHIRAE